MHADDTDDRANGPNQRTRDIDALVARRDGAYTALDASIVIMSAQQPVMLSLDPSPERTAGRV